TRANFYDLNAKVDYRINQKNTLSLSGYVSGDFLQIAADSILTIAVNSSLSQYRWSNRYGTLKWQRFFSEKFSGSATVTYTNYTAKIINPTEPNRFEIPTGLTQLNISTDFTYQRNEKHRLGFGAQAIRYRVRPENLLTPPGSDVLPVRIPDESGTELAAYVEDDFVINPKLTLTAGLRASAFLSTGPTTVTRYQAGAPRDPLSAVDSTVYGRGEVAASYAGLEPRLALKISLDESSSVKVSYNRMRQYIHLVSNTAAAIPTARWQLSNTHILPQIADQVAAGFFRNFAGSMFETSVEVYYKRLTNFLDYKDNAAVLLNRNIETAVLQGVGRAYGVEVLARKNVGEYLTGWVSYTYARTLVQMQSPFASEQVNAGAWYPANYDKPHTVNLVLNYQLKKRMGFSANYTYSTGRPATYPEGRFNYAGIIIPDFGLRNQQRIPDYHRLDIAINIDSGYRKSKKVDKSWTFAVYNLYSRNNAYSVFFRADRGSASAYKLSIFGAAFPSLTYNFKF
nr:MtrB/PioB family outer membrane beta-barrel protein [Cytophagales bacterium]